MAVHLYLAPAGHGKTAYALDRARRAAADLACTPVVCVPTQLQVRAWRQSLAAEGGAIGVRVGTFDALYHSCLDAAGEAYTELSDPIQYRLLRALVDELPLVHYSPLKDRPGFIQVLQKLVGEWKAARIQPAALEHAVADMGSEPRLGELVAIYDAYQKRLQTEGWADRAGVAWLALEALQERAPAVGRDWPLLIVDGFDNLTEVQIAVLQALAGRVGEFLVTMTGCVEDSPPRLVHQRFFKTARRLEQALQVKAESLPALRRQQPHALSFLEAQLFRGGLAHAEPTPAVECLEAPDRESEVRSALRWLKSLLVGRDGAELLWPGDVALLARDVAPYCAFILQTATEFELPIRLVGGLALRTNPAVAALLDLLRLSLPLSADDPEPSLPRRLVLEAWRSPYLDWSAQVSADNPEPVGIAANDADALDAVARWGKVIHGLSQWRDALQALAGRTSSPQGEEERALSARIPTGAEAWTLLGKFERFVWRICPPTQAKTYREYVSWVEDMIGSDPQPGMRPGPEEEEPTSLRMVDRARRPMQMGGGSIGLEEWDISALQVFKDILRGLVWAEEAVHASQSVDYARFLTDLEGAVSAATYRPPLRAEREEIVVCDVVQARGVPFRAVALLGMAEGEFPATLNEDPFLRDADRQKINQLLGARLDPSTESAEVEFFYESVLRPSERLLLTRPRLADNGADWQPSPFWEEIRRWTALKPQRLRSDSIPLPAESASWTELMESLAAYPESEGVRAWAHRVQPERLASLQVAVEVLRQRGSGDPSSYNGDLTALACEFRRAYGPDRPWSASRLEAYRACPFRFWVAHVLHLEPREEPEEGLNLAQLGNIYHRILENLYQAPGVENPADIEQLLAALPVVARQVLDEAPGREGFRATAWWQHTRSEIEEDVRHSLEELHSPARAGDYVPAYHEARFDGPDELVVAEGSDLFRLRGRIDRIDRAPDGRVRIIDFKSGGKSGYSNQALLEGKKIQLALYALAARDALHLGEPTDGFYWHVRSAEPSSLSLAKFRGEGGESALEVAVRHAWAAVRGVREGQFSPTAPDDGCPGFCPAVAFCWSYRPGFGG